MKKFLSIVLMVVMLLSVVNLTVSAEEIEGNLLSDADSNFESGEIEKWEIFHAGTMEVVDNPKGEGKVLKYQVDTDAFKNKGNTWQSFSLNLRPLLNEANTVYISMDAYVEGAFDIPITIRAKKEHLDFAAEKNSEYPRIGALRGDSNWVRGLFTIEITDEDIERKDVTWTLCLDGLPKIQEDITVYIDNVYIGYEEPDMEDLEEPENEDAELPEITPITRQENTLIGAIRWDAFFETDSVKSNVSQQVATALSPAEFHWRTPFFGNIDAEGKVTFPGYSMEVIEQEIEYAKQAGLDYFAYLWYETTDPMSDPRKLHLQSEKKNEILMCGILEKVRSNATMNELYEAMKDECYVRVDNRPVVFLYQYETVWTESMLEELRQGAANAGITEALYLVGMIGGDKNKIFENATIKGGADAFSWYGVGPDRGGGIEYVEAADICRNRITEFGNMAGACGYSLIPCVTTGYDTRPRIKNPVTWISGDVNDPDPNKWPYGNRYTLDADAEDIGALLKDTLNYVKENPNNTKANMVLTFAWNEHDEGGWMCPTIKCDENGNVLYNEDGTAQIDTQRIDAFRKNIDAYREIEHETVEPTTDVTPEVIEPTPESGSTSIDANKDNNDDKLQDGGIDTSIIITVAAVAVVIGAVVTIIIVLKKKKK